MSSRAPRRGPRLYHSDDDPEWGLTETPSTNRRPAYHSYNQTPVLPSLPESPRESGAPSLAVQDEENTPYPEGMERFRRQPDTGSVFLVPNVLRKRSHTSIKTIGDDELRYERRKGKQEEILSDLRNAEQRLLRQKAEAGIASRDTGEIDKRLGELDRRIEATEDLIRRQRNIERRLDEVVVEDDKDFDRERGNITREEVRREGRARDYFTPIQILRGTQAKPSDRRSGRV